MENEITAADRDLEIGVWPAAVPEDGDDPDTVVIQIDSGERTKHLRINLNESPIWDGDPEKVDSPEARATLMAFHRVEELEATAMQLAIDLGTLRGELAGRARDLGVNL